MYFDAKIIILSIIHVTVVLHFRDICIFDCMTLNEVYANSTSDKISCFISLNSHSFTLTLHNA